MKPKIIAIADRKGWAYDVIAHALKRYLPQYEWTIGYANEIDMINTLHAKWDLIFPLGWKWPNRDITTPPNKTISVVLSYRTLDGKSLEYWGEYMNARYCAVGACNLRLLEMLAPHVNNMTYAPCGVDTKMFTQTHKRLSEPLTAGWAGRGDDPEFRGLDIMRDACDRAGWKLKLQIAKDRMIPHDKMIDFYHDIHAYLNMSVSEGGSCAMLEAACCGVPCIATDTGVSRELITGGKTGFMVERNVDALTSALQCMTPEKCAIMGLAMSHKVHNEWSWEHQALKWSGLIGMGLEHANQ